MAEQPINKSIFMHSAEEMKDKLGPALCLAKWKQLSLHLTTGLNNSCYHPPLHAIPKELLIDNPSALHNTPYKKEQRKIMLKQERPGECSYCWNIEDLGNLSDRHYRSGEPWAAEDFDAIKNSTGEEDVIPSYVEVNFNHACNLKCSYCSPQFSSSWQAEVDARGGYPTSTIHNDPSHFVGNRRPIPARESNPYVDAFWAWWPTLYPKLKHFRMTGGEPLMDKNTYRVFDYVLALPNPDLHLNVTSNFSVEPELFEKYLSYVKQLCNTQIEHFMQYVSLDSGKVKHAEYIRDGLNVERLHNYVTRYLTEAPHRNSLTFIITMNNLSVLGLQQQLEWILVLRKAYSKTYQRVWFDTPLLRTPTWQSLQILPPAYADILERTADWMELNLETPEDPFHGFKDYEVQRLRRDIAWMRDGTKLDPVYVQKQKADFFRFFNEYDRRSNQNFLTVFPEMREWWNECEYYAKQS
jgi:organic radical activating enzyme